MKLFINRDYFNNPIPPRLFLCTTGGKRIQELSYYDGSLDAKWNSYGELGFSIDRKYVDVLDGTTKTHPAFDKTEALRQVLMEGVGLFTLQDADDNYGDKDSKSMSAFSLEYACASKYLENFRVNTGEIDSKEVIALEPIHGYDYTIDKDNLYKLATGVFDPYEEYYIKNYTDSNSHTWEQIGIKTEGDYNSHFNDGVNSSIQLYVQNYPRVRFYWPTNPSLSLLNIVAKEIPGWQIGNVDINLWHKERTFDEDRVSIYDFLMSSICDTFNAVIEWDTLNKVINVYEEAEDGINDDGAIQTRWSTDVFISRENLANEINIKVSGDEIKTKLKVSGSDDLDIREVNLGKNYIMNLDYYHTHDWMEPDLFEAYDDYLNAVEEYTPKFTEAMQGWVVANNKYNDLMNAVPAEGNVVLVGDPFEKLYCINTPIDTAYLDASLSDVNINTTFDNLYSLEDKAVTIDKTTLDDGESFTVQGYEFVYDKNNNRFVCDRNISTTTALTVLKDKLNLYHVDDDIEGVINDNILLRLKNSNSDIATIRIYDPKQLDKSGIYDETAFYYTYSTSTKKYTDVTRLITNQGSYDLYDELYTNDYKIQIVVLNSTSGISSDPELFDISMWIKGKLTVDYMKPYVDLTNYNVQYIGTMGAYLVLTKDETEEANIQDYGVNLLREKHDTYISVFQAQTEAMFSQEKYQVMASDTEPTTTFAEGTIWYDTDSNPAKWYMLTNKEWVEYTGGLENYENYQRYIDNYEKLQVIQKVLLKKERQTKYVQDGYAISDRRINIDLYHKGSDGVLRYNGQTLEGDMHRAAEAHFGTDTIVRSSMDQTLPVYYFTTSFDPATYIKNTASYSDKKKYYVKRYYYPSFITNEDEFNEQTLYIKTSQNPNVYEVATKYDASKRYCIKLDTPYYAGVSIDSQEIFDKYDGTTDEKTLYTITGGNLFAVYLKGTTPYVAYADSQGIHQATMDWISQETDFENFFNEDQWIRLSPFIREDEFSDSNFLLNGYESEEKRLEICQELMDAAAKELKTLSQPSLEFSMDMANILALPEFASLFNQFQLGNFIRVHIRDGYVKRARLLEVHLNFDDLSDFSCSFGNLVTAKSEIDKHAELLSQAVTAGKQVAQSAGSWQKAVDKTNKFEQDLANGLQNSSLQIGRASGQAISWDNTGMHFRKYKDGSTTEYEPEEMAIINNALVATNDSWRTSKAAFGKYTVNGETRWGPIAEYVTADTIEGKFLKGGSIQIGDETKEGGSLFIVHEDGSVEIISNGVEKYASVDAISEINNARQYHVELSYNKSTIFGKPGQDCTLTCKVYKWDDEIESMPSGTIYTWLRNGTVYTTTSEPTLKVTNDDVQVNAIFSCEVKFDETKIK